MLGPAGPDLLAVDHIDVALADGGGGDAGGVGAGGGLGDAEGLQPHLAAGDLGQPLALLGRRSVPQHRAHGIHLGVQRRSVGAAGVDLLQDVGRHRKAQAAAAVCLGHQDAEQPGVGHRRDELCGIGPFAVHPAPVFPGEPGAKGADGGPDLLQAVRVESGGVQCRWSVRLRVVGHGHFLSTVIPAC